MMLFGVGRVFSLQGSKQKSMAGGWLTVASDFRVPGM